MTERSVAVRLVAITQQYNDAMRASGDSTRNLGTEAELMGKKSDGASKNVDNLGKSIKNADQNAKDAKASISVLGTSIALLAPMAAALVPIAGWAVAGAGALGGMGAAGILAFGGIKNEMVMGTDLGKTYAGQLSMLGQNLQDLQHAAAAGVLGPFQQAVKDAQAQMPFLTASVSTFSTLLGKSGVNLEQGLIASLHTLMPLFIDVGVYLEGLTAKFDKWASDGGMTKFADAVRAEAPVVEKFLADLTQLTAHLLEGLAPLGMMGLTEFGMIAKAINSIPLPVLQALIPLLIDGYLAFEAYKGLSIIGDKIGGFTSKLKDSAGTAAQQAAVSKAAAASIIADDAAIDAAARVQAATMAQTAAEYQAALASEASDVALAAEAYITASAEVVAAQEAEAVAMVASADAAKAAQMATAASSRAGGLAASAGFGPLGLAVGAVTVGLGLGIAALEHHQAAAAADRAAVNSLTDAFNASNGAIDTNITLMTAKKLQDSGALDAGAKLGLSADTLTQAALGNADAMATVKSATDAATLANKNAAVVYDSSKHHAVEYNPVLLSLADAAKKVAGAVGGSNEQLTAAQKKYQQLQSATVAATAATDGQAGAQTAAANSIGELAAKYNTGAAQIMAFAETNKVTLDGTAKSEAAFITAANKALLLGSSVDTLQNDLINMVSPLEGVVARTKEFGDALAQVSTIAGGDVIRSQQSLQSSLNATANTLKTGKGAFDNFTDAGLASRAAIDASATAAGKYAADIFKATGSVQEATDAYGHWYDALVATGQAQGVSKQQIDDYLTSVGQLPQQVSDALTGTADAGAQAAQQMTNALSSGLQAGLQPLIDTLDGLIVSLGGSAVAPAYQSGAAVGSAFSAGIQDSMTTPQQVYAASVISSPSTSLQSMGIPNTITRAYKPTGPFGGLHAGSPAPPSSKSGSTGGLTAAQKAVVAQDDLLAAQALAAISPTDKLALAQDKVTEAVRRLNNETVRGTTAYYQGLVTLHQAQSDLNAEIVAERAAADAAQAALAKDVAAENALLAQESARATQLYIDLTAAATTHALADTKLIDARQTALVGWANAANVAVIQWGSSLTWLTGNINNQTQQFTDWMNALAAARKRGVSEDVITALGLDQGPQALGQLQQFSTATQAQIDALNAAIAAKSAAAGDEAHREAVNGYGQLGKDLLTEQQTYAAAVLALQAKFVSDMAAMALQVTAAQQQVTTDQTAITALPQQYKGVGTAAHGSWAPGSALYTENASGQFAQIAGVAALQSLPGSTPIFEKLYDTGGMLAPGLTFAYNKTGRPEHILTGDQFNALVSKGGMPTIRVFLGTREITDLVTEVVDDRNVSRKVAIAVAGCR